MQEYKNGQLLKQIPPQPQRQDSTNEQLVTMIMVANRLGCYDAADMIRKLVLQ